MAYSYDRNGNRLSSDTLTNTWDAANRLVSSTPADPLPEPVEGHGSGQGQAVSNLYDGLGNRVGQTVGGMTTTTYALDAAMGLAEVIFTSPLPEPVEGNGSGQVAGHAYLHLPGLIVTESTSGTRRYLLSDRLGSVRHVTDEAGQLVSTHEFDPYGVPLTESASDPYGFTGEWWQQDIGLLHLRERWYDPQSRTFLSRDPFEGHLMRPQSMNGWNYAEGNPINLTDPSGLYAWFNRQSANSSWQHRTVQDWFERSLGSRADHFWQTHHEFNQIPTTGSGRLRPDILHFPRVLYTYNCAAESPIDFRYAQGYYTGEIYEIEPLRLYPNPFQKIGGGVWESIDYYLHLNLRGSLGLLSGTFHKGVDNENVFHGYGGKRWDLNNIHWQLGGTMPMYQLIPLPARPGQSFYVISPLPGLILYLDQTSVNQFKAVGLGVTAATVTSVIRQIMNRTWKFNPSLRPSYGTPGLFIVPEFLIDPSHPYNPLNPLNCWDFPEVCEGKGVVI